MSQNPVQSLSKALAVLNAVASFDAPATIAAIAKRTGIPRPTAYRLVASLQAEGYLLEADGGYAIGFELLPLAAALLDKNPLRLAALPHLQALSERTGERTNLGILQRGRVMILGGFERPSLPTIYSRFGRAIPAHRSALGKALLSQLPVEDVAAIVGPEPFAQSTARTITSMDVLLADLEETRRRGYAAENGENSETSRCIAALIAPEDGTALGAISISTSVRTGADVSEFVEDLLRTAEVIAHVARGYRKQEPSRRRVARRRDPVAG